MLTACQLRQQREPPLVDASRDVVASVEGERSDGALSIESAFSRPTSSWRSTSRIPNLWRWWSIAPIHSPSSAADLAQK